MAEVNHFRPPPERTALTHRNQDVILSPAIPRPTTFYRSSTRATKFPSPTATASRRVSVDTSPRSNTPFKLQNAPKPIPLGTFSPQRYDASPENMERPKPKHSKWPIAVFCAIFAPVLYVLSYAPYLACCGYPGIIDRTPKFYRAAEWLLLKTHTSGALTLWHEAFGVEGAVDLQLFFYVQGAEDLSEWTFNIQSY